MKYVKLFEAFLKVNEASVILDTALDTPEDEKVFFEYLKANGIKHKVINAEGPAGGHPEIEYTGSKEALMKMIDDKFDDGSGDLSFYYDMIEESITEAVKFDVEFEAEEDGQFHIEEESVKKWSFSPVPPIKVVSIEGTIGEEANNISAVLSNGDKLQFEAKYHTGPPNAHLKNYGWLTINDKKHDVKDRFMDNLESYGSFMLAFLNTYAQVQYSDETLGAHGN
jgi:hypothetical protein